MSVRIVVLWPVLGIWAQIASIDRLHDDLSRFLSIPRFTPSEKSQTRIAVRQTFERLGLHVISHTFSSEDTDEIGVNLLSIQEGPHYGTPNDKVVIVAANYDTEEGVPGVDDNGSGVAAVLETARTLATFDQVYRRLYTIIYALFDLKHQDLSTCKKANKFAIFNAFAGSHAFVEEVLLPYLTISNASVSGVLVLDGLLHFDAFPTSQSVPNGFDEMFPTAARELYEHGHMGDYIQLIGRERKDDNVLQNFFDAFDRSTARLTHDWSFRPWLLLLRLPMHTITSVDDVHRMHSYLFADHSSFFFHSNPHLDLPTIHISDTLKFRGVRQYCPYCDSLFMLSEPNMRFLTVIVETVIRTVVFLSESEARTVVDDLYRFQYPYKVEGR
ncbi:hypothetical protein GCK32_003752 [Trichostrongylus colubriformis]|uniref:Peptidase M28 domain-containing protein n=1 Tax=Trichostrongylus colubriformis TaxID=6319 RepID=A0AAN8FG29_TRICO